MKYLGKEKITILEFLQEKNQYSKAKVKSLLSYHAILCNQKVLRRIDEIIQFGDVIEIKKKEKVFIDPRLQILYEDTDFIAVNKPFGLLSIKDKTKEETMYQIVSSYLKEKEKNSHIFVLHRLDKDTSGVLVFAKKEKIKYQMQAKWNSLVTLREYIALVEGNMKKEKGRIETYLDETSTHLVYSTSKEKGKLAITNYNVIKRKNGYTYLRITLETGRKHQIRVSMKDLGYPIAGDKKYGAKTDPFKRLMLHASKIEFINPNTKKKILIEAPLPNALKKI